MFLCSNYTNVYVLISLLHYNVLILTYISYAPHSLSNQMDMKEPINTSNMNGTEI